MTRGLGRSGSRLVTRGDALRGWPSDLSIGFAVGSSTESFAKHVALRRHCPLDRLWLLVPAFLVNQPPQGVGEGGGALSTQLAVGSRPTLTPKPVGKTPLGFLCATKARGTLLVSDESTQLIGALVPGPIARCFVPSRQERQRASLFLVQRGGTALVSDPRDGRGIDVVASAGETPELVGDTRDEVVADCPGWWNTVGSVSGLGVRIHDLFMRGAWAVAIRDARSARHGRVAGGGTSGTCAAWYGAPVDGTRTMGVSRSARVRCARRPHRGRRLASRMDRRRCG